MSADDRDATEVSENRSWVSIHSLLTSDLGNGVALIGAPLVRESLTPGRCDLAPDVVRGTLKRLSVYDLESRTDLSSLRISDAGDLPIAGRTPAEAFAPLSKGIRELTRRHALT